MLRISRLADYGVVLSTHLASMAPGELRSTSEMSSRTGIPQPTVSKILKTLAKAEVVQSVRGVHGGYRLARSAEDTSVAEVITALEGPIGVTECGVDGEDLDCQLSGRCDVRGNWQRINTAIQGALEGISLAEMAQPAVAALVSLGRRHADGHVVPTSPIQPASLQSSPSTQTVEP